MSLVTPAAEGKLIDTDYYVEGYFTTYDKPYVLATIDGVEYKEVVARGALDDADLSDVILQYDHNGKVLARTSNHTIILDINRQYGPFMAGDISKSQEARNLYEEVKNDLVTGMSWGFTVKEDKYDRETHTRTILKIGKVYDVSAVSIPANGDTLICARSWIDGVIDAESREAVERKRQKIRILCNT